MAIVLSEENHKMLRDITQRIISSETREKKVKSDIADDIKALAKASNVPATIIKRIMNSVIKETKDKGAIALDMDIARVSNEIAG